MCSKKVVPIVIWTLGACLLTISQARADVRDQAGMFSAQAVQNANARISQIQQKTSKSIVIETVSALPSGTTIDNEAHNRFQAQRINGVLVLISNNPKKIAVRVGAKTAEVFGADQRARLRQTFIDYFKQRDFDGGLRAAVDYADGVFAGALSVTRRVQEVPRTTQRSPSYTYQPHSRPSGGFSLSKIILLVLGVLFVVFLIRGIVGAFQGGGYGGKPDWGGGGGWGGGGWGGGGWGGGFLSGLMGGVVGSLIGNSLYNWFSGSHHHGGHYDQPASYADDSSAQQSAGGWMQDDNAVFGGDVGESSDWGSDVGGDVGDSSSFDSGGSDW
jgi:uncharacterized protein